MKLINTKLYTILGLLIIVFMVFYALNTDSAESDLKIMHKTTKKFHGKFVPKDTKMHIGQRIVHLDLKGAPLKISYYSKLLPLLKKLGATGILIEYEDMFPYTGLLSKVSARNAYTIEDIKAINAIANKNYLQVIPLIQGFREMSRYPSTICPSNVETVAVLGTMIQQIIDVHYGIDTIHIGCGAVPYLGHCQRCTNRILTQKISKNQLFIEHVHAVIDLVKQKNSNLKVLIWDDIFRTSKQDEIEKDYMKNGIIPVVWWYGKDVYEELGPSLWNTYGNVFESVWLASAYKGTAGTNKYISDMNHYMQNQKSWLSVIEEYQTKLKFQGIILMGAQRYDHFASLCELIPVGIPALAMSLRLVQGFKDSPLGPPLEIARLLQCDQPYGLIGTAFGSPKCKFPGADVLETMIHFHQLQQDFLELTDDYRLKGWLSEYNKLHSYSNPRKVEEIAVALDKIKKELDVAKTSISNAMLELYDNFTVTEWLLTYLSPLEKEVLSFWEAKERVLGRSHWQRRPLYGNEEF